MHRGGAINQHLRIAACIDLVYIGTLMQYPLCSWYACRDLRLCVVANFSYVDALTHTRSASAQLELTEVWPLFDDPDDRHRIPPQQDTYDRFSTLRDTEHQTEHIRDEKTTKIYTKTHTKLQQPDQTPNPHNPNKV